MSEAPCSSAQNNPDEEPPTTNRPSSAENNPSGSDEDVPINTPGNSSNQNPSPQSLDAEHGGSSGNSRPTTSSSFSNEAGREQSIESQIDQEVANMEYLTVNDGSVPPILFSAEEIKSAEPPKPDSKINQAAEIASNQINKNKVMANLYGDNLSYNQTSFCKICGKPIETDCPSTSEETVQVCLKCKKSPFLQSSIDLGSPVYNKWREMQSRPSSSGSSSKDVDMEEIESPIPSPGASLVRANVKDSINVYTSNPVTDKNNYLSEGTSLTHSPGFGIQTNLKENLTPRRSSLETKEAASDCSNVFSSQIKSFTNDQISSVSNIGQASKSGVDTSDLGAQCSTSNLHGDGLQCRSLSAPSAEGLSQDTCSSSLGLNTSSELLHSLGPPESSKDNSSSPRKSAKPSKRATPYSKTRKSKDSSSR